VTRTSLPKPLGTEASRRSREQTSDYSLFELLSLTDYEYAGACSSDGRPAHVVTFRPPDSFDPLNPVERVVSAMSGTIVIDGLDFQVARAEGSTVAPITWGAGMVALKSAHVLFDYARVHGEVWLPQRDVFEFHTRVLLDTERERVTHLFDDFRKATTETEVEFDLEPPAP
jgi:hypothetical protein